MAARESPRPPFQILSVVGTRPEAIKMAPVVRAIALRPAIEHRLLLTGQHAGLADAFPGAALDDLALDVRNRSVVDLRLCLAGAIRRYLAPAPPDLVIVHGDTTSALAGALAAKACGIPVAHVEAGLRSHSREPWPEEENRVAIDAIAALLFAPTDSAAANLAAEPAATGAVHVTGNTGIDAVLCVAETLAPATALAGPRTIIVTCHRRENQGAALSRICAALRELARIFPVRILVLLHPNRHVRAAVQAELAGCAGIELIEPVDHAGMVRLIFGSWIILTDSGGLQEEGPALGRPVLVLRDVTERIEAPANVELVGTSAPKIVAAVSRLLADDAHYARMAQPVLAFGDGQAGPRIAALIEQWLRGRPRTAD
jgi:UDP-N-acetylglucosamine 2-epimerase (non-hydrolysing)